jgi:hypothetical protein
VVSMVADAVRSRRVSVAPDAVLFQGSLLTLGSRSAWISLLVS